MSSLNKAIICGRVGRTPKSGATESGKVWAKFSVATSEKFGGQERTEWHNVTAWDKTAEYCRDYLDKGALVLVEGRIETRKYTGKDGIEKYATEIVAQRGQGLVRAFGIAGQGYAQPLWNPRRRQVGIRLLDKDSRGALRISGNQRHQFHGAGFWQQFGLVPVPGQYPLQREPSGLLVATIDIQPREQGQAEAS